MYLASKGRQGKELGALCSLRDREIQAGHFYLSSGTDASNAQQNDLVPPPAAPGKPPGFFGPERGARARECSHLFITRRGIVTSAQVLRGRRSVTCVAPSLSIALLSLGF